MGEPQRISGIRLVPSAGGVFDVRLAGDLVFSKKAIGRHAELGEVEAIVAKILGG